MVYFSQLNNQKINKHPICRLIKIFPVTSIKINFNLKLFKINPKTNLLFIFINTAFIQSLRSTKIILNYEPFRI